MRDHARFLLPFKQQGFNLIEIMMTLSIIVIICHFLLINYQTLIAAQKRHVAEAVLFQLASAMEEYAMKNMTYQGATLSILHVDEFAANKSYLMSIDKVGEQDYLISARPRVGQVENDKRCGILSLAGSGKKYISGKGSMIDCW